MIQKRTICVMARGADQDDGQGVYNRSLLRELFVLDPQTTWIVLLTTDKCRDLFSGFPNVGRQGCADQIQTVLGPDSRAEYRQTVQRGPDFQPQVLNTTIYKNHPVCSSLHGSDWYINPRNYTWWDNLYIRLMMPIYCRKAAELLSISETIAKDLENYAGIDPSKVTVSYAAPNENFQQCDDQEILKSFRNRYGLPKKFILTVLRVQHNVYKGIYTLPRREQRRCDACLPAISPTGWNAAHGRCGLSDPRISK